MVKNWPNNDKIVFGKHEIFTKALAKINFENHKELTMNEVHVTTAKVVLISLISGAAVALITHLFFEISIKKLNAFGRFFELFSIKICVTFKTWKPHIFLEFFSTLCYKFFVKNQRIDTAFLIFLITISMTNVTQP